ncbi:hypothetical protein [Lysobacter capsici]|uniref:hypothetical protein n=1 Tax=Lysobacter capsici TaxID=435897 RepID=UPI00287B7042|nr:hypothetical protein [Lysobacter capsici]WND82102.1 hypothetical protein RJ610_06985 [Lysobacter capsici]WND87297.1 hypothetical protein RJ609_06985 [Lysobacter capsici]
MKQRRVYRTDDIAQATRAVEALRAQGISDDDISLVARSDIELQSIPNRHKEADTDFMPAAVRGAGIGGATGLLAGLAATVVMPVGITLAGAAVVGAVGALVGTWASALMGAALPDPIRQKFDDEIAAGRILVLVDAESPMHERLGDALANAGATLLDYDALASMT